MRDFVLPTKKDAKRIREDSRSLRRLRGLGALNANGRVSLSPAERAGARGLPSSDTQRFLVSAVANDYLTCKLIRDDGSVETDTVNIAKPQALRHDYTIYNGLTSLTTTDAQTVSATDGSTTETWKVTPDYAVNTTEIYAIPYPNGGTGVKVSGAELIWLDTNADGRAWAVDE